RIADAVAGRVYKGRSIVDFEVQHGDGEYDPDQEEDVLERYRRNFVAHTLPPELGEAYARLALMATRGVWEGDIEYVSDTIRRLRERQRREKAEVVSSP
ncbi:MAG: hypothetical protein HYW27_00695, partial [Candidatus Aenigmarchaeota archaeon]|nr:hypothetical protein [Candidatus Aenigmarchaeota archaeon]